MNTKTIDRAAGTRSSRSGKLGKVASSIAVGGLFLLASCGGSDESAAVSGAESLGFVGTVEGTDAFVSVIVGEGDAGANEAVVYVCDGQAELREWFSGPVGDLSSFESTNEAGARISAQLTDGEYRGDFTDTDGTVHGFETVAATGEAGLYEVDDELAATDGVWAAWVVDNEGNQRGAFLRGGVFQPTPRLSSANFRLSRFSVTNGVIEMNGIVAPNN